MQTDKPPLIGSLPKLVLVDLEALETAEKGSDPFSPTVLESRGKPFNCMGLNSLRI